VINNQSAQNMKTWYSHERNNYWDLFGNYVQYANQIHSYNSRISFNFIYS